MVVLTYQWWYLHTNGGTYIPMVVLTYQWWYLGNRILIPKASKLPRIHVSGVWSTVVTTGPYDTPSTPYLLQEPISTKYANILRTMEWRSVEWSPQDNCILDPGDTNAHCKNPDLPS